MTVTQDYYYYCDLCVGRRTFFVDDVFPYLYTFLLHNINIEGYHLILYKDTWTFKELITHST